MKAAYLGGTRGHQSAMYRPGAGWSRIERRRKFGRNPLAAARGGAARVTPLSVAYRRRPGLLARALIVSTVVLVAVLMAMVLSGVTLF